MDFHVKQTAEFLHGVKVYGAFENASNLKIGSAIVYPGKKIRVNCRGFLLKEAKETDQEESA